MLREIEEERVAAATAGPCNDTSSVTADAVTPSPQGESCGETEEPEKKQKDKPMSAETLAGLLQKVAKGWPEATVECADEGMVSAACLCIDYGPEGEERNVRLRLYTCGAIDAAGDGDLS